MSAPGADEEGKAAASDTQGGGASEPAERGRHERQRGTRVLTLELSRVRIERLIAKGLLDEAQCHDRALAAAVKALIDDEAASAAAVPPDGADLCVPVMLDPEEQEFMLESQLLPVHGRADRHGMARVFKKLLGEARGHWLQFNAPQRRAARVAVASAPLGAAALAAIQARHRSDEAAAAREAAPVRVVPREAQKAYLRSWQRTGVWPREWGPLPDQPGTVIVDEEVRAVFGLDSQRDAQRRR